MHVSTKIVTLFIIDISNEKIEGVGWEPNYSLDDGIKELIKAYQIIPNINTTYTNL